MDVISRNQRCIGIGKWWHQIFGLRWVDQIDQQKPFCSIEQKNEKSRKKTQDSHCVCGTDVPTSTFAQIDSTQFPEQIAERNGTRQITDYEIDNFDDSSSNRSLIS